MCAGPQFVNPASAATTPNAAVLTEELRPTPSSVRIDPLLKSEPSFGQWTLHHVTPPTDSSTEVTTRGPTERRLPVRDTRAPFGDSPFEDSPFQPPSAFAKAYGSERTPRDFGRTRSAHQDNYYSTPSPDAYDSYRSSVPPVLGQPEKWTLLAKDTDLLNNIALSAQFYIGSKTEGKGYLRPKPPSRVDLDPDFHPFQGFQINKNREKGGRPRPTQQDFGPTRQPDFDGQLNRPELRPPFSGQDQGFQSPLGGNFQTTGNQGFSQTTSNPGNFQTAGLPGSFQTSTLQGTFQSTGSPGSFLNTGSAGSFQQGVGNSGSFDGTGTTGTFQNIGTGTTGSFQGTGFTSNPFQSFQGSQNPSLAPGIQNSGSPNSFQLTGSTGGQNAFQIGSQSPFEAPGTQPQMPSLNPNFDSTSISDFGSPSVQSFPTPPQAQITSLLPVPDIPPTSSIAQVATFASSDPASPPATNIRVTFVEQNDNIPIIEVGTIAPDVFQKDDDFKASPLISVTNDNWRPSGNGAQVNSSPLNSFTNAGQIGPYGSNVGNVGQIDPLNIGQVGPTNFGQFGQIGNLGQPGQTGSIVPGTPFAQTYGTFPTRQNDLYNNLQFTVQPGGPVHPFQQIRLPVTSYHPPQSNYGVVGAPPNAYASPQSTYGLPKSSYGVPKSTYGAPQSTYSPPKTTYGSPQSTYGIPQSTYGTPQATYSPPQQTYGVAQSSYSVPQSYNTPQAPLQQNYGNPTQTYGVPKATYGAPKALKAHKAAKAAKGYKGSKGKGLKGTYGAPKATYGVPQQGYGAPQQNYAVHQQAYSTPQGYGVPQQTYGAAPQNFAVGQQSYSFPQQGYSLQSQLGAVRPISPAHTSLPTNIPPTPQAYHIALNNQANYNVVPTIAPTVGLQYASSVISPLTAGSQFVNPLPSAGYQQTLSSVTSYTGGQLNVIPATTGYQQSLLATGRATVQPPQLITTSHLPLEPHSSISIQESRQLPPPAPTGPPIVLSSSTKGIEKIAVDSVPMKPSLLLSVNMASSPSPLSDPLEPTTWKPPTAIKRSYTEKEIENSETLSASSITKTEPFDRYNERKSVISLTS